MNSQSGTPVGRDPIEELFAAKLAELEAGKNRVTDSDRLKALAAWLSQVEAGGRSPLDAERLAALRALAEQDTDPQAFCGRDRAAP